MLNSTTDHTFDLTLNDPPKLVEEQISQMIVHLAEVVRIAATTETASDSIRVDIDVVQSLLNRALELRCKQFDLHSEVMTLRQKFDEYVYA